MNPADQTRSETSDPPGRSPAEIAARLAANSPGPARSGVRWWPLAVVLAASLACLAWLWLGPGEDPSHRNLSTQILGLVTGVLSLAWLVFFSRLPGRMRATMGGLAAVLAAALAASVRLEGLSGGLWFDLAWRWQPRPAAAAGTTDEFTGARADLEHTTAHDFPQFLGPRRTAQVAGLVWQPNAETPLREVWRRPLGQGWSSFAIVGDYAVTQEQRAEGEGVACYRLSDGSPVWWSLDPETPPYHSVLAGNGPRATPTVAGGMVYTIGVSGRLRCLHGATGAEQWAVNVLAQHQGRVHQWGESDSPLVYDDLVVVTAGLPEESQAAADHVCLAAYERTTGELHWATPGDGGDYSSPVLVELAGRRQVLLVSKNMLAGYDPEEGRRLWRYDWPNPEGNIANPVVVGTDRVLVSSGYGWGCALVRVSLTGDQARVEEVWRNKNLKAKFANFVVHEGYVYGLDDGILTCVDLETGRRQWKRGRYGHGQMLLAGDRLLIQTEEGPVVLVAIDPTEHRELGRVDALQDKTWNNPALAPPYLLVRNDREAVCFRLALEAAESAPEGKDVGAYRP